MSNKVDLILLRANLEQVQARTLLSDFRSQNIAANITVVFGAWTPSDASSARATPGLLHVYLKLDAQRRVTKSDIRKIEVRWSNLSKDPEATACRMQKVFETSGAAAGRTPAFHYVVQTTPEKGWFKEISKWYDEEHMPGLAGVPGCIHAVRMLNLDHGPRSFAYYDLVGEGVMGSPEWLAVRATDWSSRCRPHFTNTRRNMFQVV